MDHSFGSWVRERRKAMDLTQEGLAERVCCSAVTIRRLEGGQRRPSRQFAARLAECLGMDATEQQAFVARARAPLSRSDAVHRAADAPTVPYGDSNASPTGLLGRDRQLEDLRRALRDPGTRLLTLTGPGGVGKTALAMALVREVASGGGRDVLAVSLAPLRDPGLVVSAIAQGLGLREIPGQSLQESVREHLRARSLLLVLDNVEHLLPAAPLVADLLAACPKLVVLATSRALLHIRDERLMPVRPLPLPETSDRAQLAANPAVALFLRRAWAVLPDFAPDGQDIAAIAAICRRVDGLPLAIELAAARLPVLPPRAMLARIEPSLPLLTGGARDLPSRQRTLRATLDWSHALLDPWQQALLARLAIFACGCTLAAAEAVCGPAAADGATVLDGIAALVAHSLVGQRPDPDGEPRFLLLETVREYALALLTTTGELPAISGAHARWCLELAEQAAPHLASPDAAGWLDRLEREHDNFRAALGWCATTEHAAAIGLRLAVALSSFWWVRGYFGEGQRWLETLLAAAGTDADADVQARALHASGQLADIQADHQRATALHERGLALRRRGGDPRRIAESLHAVAIADWPDDPYRRTTLCQESLALYREVGDPDGVATVLNTLGRLAGRLGDYSRAARHYRETIALLREHGQGYELAIALNNLGHVLRKQEQYVQARAALEESLAVARRFSHRYGIALALSNLGALARQQGEYSHALRLLHEAYLLQHALGDAENVASTVGAMARTVALQGRMIVAARLFGMAAAAWRAAGAAPPPSVQVDYDRDIDRVREALGAEHFAAEWRLGETLPRGEALPGISSA